MVVHYLAMYIEYLLETSNASFSSTFSFDDCVECERISIKNSHVDSMLELLWIMRGMSMIEVVNLIGCCFKVKHSNVETGVLREESEYLIQQDPKNKSNPLYNLVEGQNSPLQISFQDLVQNQRIKIPKEVVRIVSIKVPRSWYLMEECNKTSIVFKVKRGEFGGVSIPNMDLVTLQERKEVHY